MIDETYVEFTDTDTYSCTQLVDDYSNLFVIRGTSKFFNAWNKAWIWSYI